MLEIVNIRLTVCTFECMNFLVYEVLQIFYYELSAGCPNLGLATFIENVGTPTF